MPNITHESDQGSQRERLLRELEARRLQASIGPELVQQQRARTSWSEQRSDGVSPTWDGLLAGSTYGVLASLGGLAVVTAATLGSPAFRAASSPGGRAWLVCTCGMAGFFVNSEMAVVGSDARAKARARANPQ